jgi:hypothetical protein
MVTPIALERRRIPTPDIHYAIGLKKADERLK